MELLDCGLELRDHILFEQEIGLELRAEEDFLAQILPHGLNH